MISIFLIAILLTAAEGPSPRLVPWSDVQAAVGETVCVVAEPRIPQGYRVSVGDRETCGLPPAATPLSRAAQRAFEEARPLMVSVPPVFSAVPEGIEAAYSAESDPERNRIAREAYLGHEEFLRVLLPRLRTALRAEGLACEGCPAFNPTPVRRIAWDDFSPYVTAYVWPDPVRTPVGPDGKASGRPNYSFHICGGLNGVSEMEDPDPVLLRAGFLAAFKTQAIRKQTASHFQGILGESSFRELREDEARTVYLRKRLTEELHRDAAVREGVCQTLQEFSKDLAVELADCGGGEP